MSGFCRDWPFVAELNAPLHPPRPFGDGPNPGGREVDFRSGLRLEWGFPDPDGRLVTAYADFHDFLHSISLPAECKLPLRTERARELSGEAFRITVRKAGITLASGDVEGIRRGLVELEDRILARRRAALPVGVVLRRPLIRTRLSRCCFGPINRPPHCRDELLDDIDYYPDGYLNRLAHLGVNALWLSIRFRDLLDSAVLPELTPDPHAARRLNKLRRTIAQCARYGIRVFCFCIEPAALPSDSPVLKAHPEIQGADAPGGRSLFCTGNSTGQTYLEEMGRRLLTEASGLGGLICIPVGERFTHCCSGRLPTHCPRCAPRKPWEVLADTLAALARGMHGVDPAAELIAWPYSQLPAWGADAMRTAAGHLPPGVILQHNFETGGSEKQLGKWRPLWDYWLSCVGPSPMFADCARAARRNGTRMFAKVQTSCSHEVATTQFVPAPGLLYRKYRRMHALGVSGVMQGWYFGNHPSLMTRASARLAMAPLPNSEAAFLRELAEPVWGPHAAQVVEAWRHFTEAYAGYPAAQRFSYYGPMHDGIVWPLHLVPRRLPLAPTWRNVHPVSGDQVSECISADFTYGEVLSLCRTIRDRWRKGAAILKGLSGDPGLPPDARREINVALALEIHFDCGYNTLQFYALREHLAAARTRRRQTALLERLHAIAVAEVENGERMLRLCADNPSLGFHAEAEGYKYDPPRIRRRMAQLRRLLRVEFPRIAGQCGQFPLSAFADDLGHGKALRSPPCLRVPEAAVWTADPFAPEWATLPETVCRHRAAPRAADAARPFPFNSALHPVSRSEPWTVPPLRWRAVYDRQRLHLCLAWTLGEGDALPPDPERDEIRITVEPRALEPFRAFILGRNHPYSAATGVPATGRAIRDGELRLTVALPLQALGRTVPSSAAPPEPLRFNLSWFVDPIVDCLCVQGNPRLNTWAPMRSTLARNLMGYHDPGAYGWLVFG